MRFTEVMALVILALMLIAYPLVVPQEVSPKIMVLNGSEVMSGTNGRVLDASLGSRALDDSFERYDNLCMNYTFRGGNYTTGYAEAGVVRPLYIAEDGDAVANYANDSRFLSARFYVSARQGSDAGNYIKEAKVVCNAERTYYEVEKVPSYYYGKTFYRSHCEITHGQQQDIPAQAIITYAPDWWCYFFTCVLLDFVIWLLFRTVDEYLVP